MWSTLSQGDFDYWLAPEAKFPAQHDDALATYKWGVQNSASINGDPKRLALAGESAGGNLALATAIAARDQGLTRPAYVVAVNPIAQASDRSICAVPRRTIRNAERISLWILKRRRDQPRSEICCLCSLPYIQRPPFVLR